MNCFKRICLAFVLLSIAFAAAPPKKVSGTVFSDQEKVPDTFLKVTNQRDFLQHLAWSPDGSKFLVTRIHAGKMGLWTVSADGKEWKRLLAENEQPHFDGSWSPDGKKIVFVYDRLQGTDGKLQIDIMNADGSGRQNLVPHANAFDESPRWSPDGKEVAWVSTRTKNQEIHVVGADGKDIRRLTGDPAFDNNPS